MTMTLDEAVYDGLHRVVGKRRMSQFTEDLVRPHVVRPHVLGATLEAGYKAMAADQCREADAMEWCHALAADIADASR